MISGFLNVYKESGMTSHDVVNKIRKIFNTKAVGHTGTLDPNATGVLVVAVGKATKCIEYLENDDKTYCAQLKFGIKTDTEDIWGTVLETKEEELNKEKAEEIIKSFVGKQNQIPPMYSAIKVNGKKLYEYAREGVEIERKNREIEIYDIRDVNVEEDKASFTVDCSKGTYIRTLCSNIGEKLGCGAVMSALERTRVGTFLKEQSHTINEIAEMREELLTGLEFAIGKFPIINLEGDTAQKYLNGVELKCEQNNGKYRIYINNTLYGIGKIESKILKSEKRIQGENI